jgi:hypothetical protein
MAVLSNNGRLISSLPILTSIGNSDEFILQSNGTTKRVSFYTLQTSVLNSYLNPFSGVVKLTNSNNQFTGSFNGNIKGNVTGNITGGLNKTITAGDGLSGGGTLSSNLSFAVDSTVVRTTGTQTIGGSKTFSSTITGNINSSGTSTFTTANINGGSINGTSIGSTSQSTIKGTQITASTRFLGSLNGDLYTSNGDKVLENGTSANPGGNVPSAYFYGTSSYASQALTAAYAVAGGSIVNGLPSGGSKYQVLTKNSSTNYDTVWSTPITRSGSPSAPYLAYWTDNKTLAQAPNFQYNSATDTYIVQSAVTSNRGINLISNALTGSYVSRNNTKTIDTINVGKIIDGVQYQSVILQLSQSAPVTMSLLSGQTCRVLVKNSGAYNVTHWSGSLNGTTANTKIYWPNGTEPTITSGNLKKDLLTFTNVENFILATIDQNFLSKI